MKSRVLFPSGAAVSRSDFPGGSTDRILFLFARLITVAVLTVLSAYVPLAYSEELEIEDTFFSIDKREIVDSNNERLTLGAQVELLPVADVPARVVRYYFVESEEWKKFQSAQLERFVLQSATDSKLEWSALGLLAFARYPDITDERVESFLGRLQESPQYGEVLKVAIGMPVFSELPAQRRGRLIYETALIAPSFVRSRSLSLVFRDIDVIGDALIEGYLHAAAQAASRDKILNVAREVLGSSDRRYNALRVAEDSLKLFEAGVAARDRARIQMGFDRARSIELRKGALESFMVNQVVESGTVDISASQPGMALNLLSAIPDQHRTPRVYEVAYEAINSMPDGELGALLEPNYRRFLASLLSGDEGLRHLVEKRVSEGIMQRMSEDRVGEGERLFDLILMVRPDPSVENDQLRGKIAMALLSVDKRNSAALWLSQIQGTLPIAIVTQLYVRGAYGFRWVPFLALLICGGIAFFRGGVRDGGGSVRARQIRRGDRAAALADTEEEEDDAFDERINFRVLRRVQQSSPDMEEYLECLKALGVSETATLKQIKDAYRREVKKFHPDRISEMKVSGEDFMQLTKSYQRCIELRKRLAVD